MMHRKVNLPTSRRQKLKNDKVEALLIMDVQHMKDTLKIIYCWNEAAGDDNDGKTSLKYDL